MSNIIPIKNPCAITCWEYNLCGEDRKEDSSCSVMIAHRLRREHDMKIACFAIKGKKCSPCNSGCQHCSFKELSKQRILQEQRFFLSRVAAGEFKKRKHDPQREVA